MLKKMVKVMLVVLAITTTSGCSSTQKTVKKEPQQTTTTVKKIETRFYADDRKRVDQEMKGNFGYLSGTPVPEDRTDFNKTRRIYVLEVTKNVAEDVQVEDVQIEPYRPSPSKPLPPVRDLPDPDWTKPVSIPPIKMGSEPQGDPYFEDYVIEEGDTLQKISKKFYDSYSKWLKIYEANSDVIKDPNRVKPGMKIRIPMNQ